MPQYFSCTFHFIYVSYITVLFNAIYQHTFFYQRTRNSYLLVYSFSTQFCTHNNTRSSRKKKSYKSVLLLGKTVYFFFFSNFRNCHTISQHCWFFHKNTQMFPSINFCYERMRLVTLKPKQWMCTSAVGKMVSTKFPMPSSLLTWIKNCFLDKKKRSWPC